MEIHLKIIQAVKSKQKQLQSVRQYLGNPTATVSGVDKDSSDRAAWWEAVALGGVTYTIQNFVLGSIRLDSFLSTNGSVLDSHYKIWE